MRTRGFGAAEPGQSGHAPRDVLPVGREMRFYSPFPVHLLLLTVFVAVVYSQPSHAQDSIAGVRLPKRLVGDYGYWSKFSRPPYSAAQIPFQKLTHVNHAGVSFDAGGTLFVPDGFIEPRVID